MLKIGLKWHEIKNNLSIFILMKNIISLQISANRNEMMLADVNGNFFHTNLINVRCGMNEYKKSLLNDLQKEIKIQKE